MRTRCVNKEDQMKAKNEELSNLFDIDDIIDDIWIDICCLLNIKDLLSIRTSCKRFNNLTNPTTNNRINSQWRYYCANLCIDIESTNFIVENCNWYIF